MTLKFTMWDAGSNDNNHHISANDSKAKTFSRAIALVCGTLANV